MRLVVLACCLWSPLAAADAWNFPTELVGVASVTATSTYADKHDAYAAWHVVAYSFNDGLARTPSPFQVHTAWCEGKPDEGLGEAITITLHAPVMLLHWNGRWRLHKIAIES